jgi:glycosyltransferase involved in cell wall biosynthesis
MMFFKKIFGSRTSKFILLNISLKRLWQGNHHKPFKRFLLNWLLKELDAVVCLSKEQVSFCEENFPYLGGKIFFVPLGVDTIYNKFTREGRQDFILSAGRDDARDYGTVLAIAKELPDKKFEIVASPRNLKGVGDTPPNVKVSFDIPPRELSEKYSKAQMLLLLTHSDGFKEGADGSGQTVLLEAFASGLPVVGTARASLRDYVVDGKTALLSDFYDTQGIIGNIRKLDNANLGDALARNARVATEEMFSSIKMSESLAAVFKEVVLSK